jgi:TfoX/Sxy family transcriptional regulator of competence genes
MSVSPVSKRPVLSDGHEDRFEQVTTALLKRKGVEQGKMFGSVGLKVNGKVFAMCVKDALVIKLPNERAQALVSSKKAKPFDPGHGRVMKEWVCVAEGTAQSWLALIQESHTYVAALEAKKSK